MSLMLFKHKEGPTNPEKKNYLNNDSGYLKENFEFIAEWRKSPIILV